MKKISDDLKNIALSKIPPKPAPVDGEYKQAKPKEVSAKACYLLLYFTLTLTKIFNETILFHWCLWISASSSHAPPKSQKEDERC